MNFLFVLNPHEAIDILKILHLLIRIKDVVNFLTRKEFPRNFQDLKTQTFQEV